MEEFAINSPNWSFGSRLNAKDNAFAYYSNRYHYFCEYGEYGFRDDEGHYYDGDNLRINFWQALERGNCESVREWIKKGASPNDADEYGIRPLMVAAARGRADMANVLLELGADIDARGTNGKTALMAAIFNGHAELAMMLLEKGASPDIQDNNGYTALMLAACNGEARIARILLEGGALPNIKDKNGSTALVAAAFYAKRHTESGDDAVAGAKKGAGLAAVRALLANGANPDVCVAEGGDPLLIWAVKNDDAPLVRVLLAGGADPKIRAKGRWSALAYTDNESIVKMFYAASKKRSANMNKAD